MSKISELSDGGALQSTDYLIAVRSGGNVKVQPAGMTFSSVTITSSDINGGNIDGTTIGGTTPAAGTFSSLTATTVDINGGTIDGVTIGGSSAGAITGTTGQFNTSLNVDGTVTADGLTLDGAALVRSGNTLTLNRTDNAIGGAMSYVAGTGFIFNDANGDGTSFNAGAANRLRIASNGDVSLFEDTGTTAKFFWDASAESLGIGTSSPSTPLDVTTAGGGNFVATFQNTTSATPYGVWIKEPASAANGYPSFQVTDSTGSTVRFRVDSGNGNVGIGRTSSSVVRLSVAGIDSGSSNYAFEATNSSNNTKFIVRNDGLSAFYKSDNSESMRLDASGNLLVGTAAKFSIGRVCSLAADGVASFETKPSTNISYNAAHFLNSSNTLVGRILCTGSATSYVTSSDERLKENITDANDAGAKVDAIQVRQFDWKADGSHQDYGMIAQELLTVAPEAVSGDPESDDMMGVDYSKLVPMLVKEIQSLRARVAQLEGV